MLRRMRKRADKTQAQIAEAIDRTQQTYQRYEAGTSGAVLRVDELSRIAAAMGYTYQDVMDERDREIRGQGDSLGGRKIVPMRRPEPGVQDTGELPIRDRVQAGAWLQADDLDQDEPRRWPASRDPRFPQARQWLSEVLGDSVNRLNIFEGDLVHCVDVISAGYSPRTGNVVEVERLRREGSERELTLKEVEIDADGKVWLWPRSTNSRWQDPIVLGEGTREGEEYEVRIRSVVVNVLRRLQL